MLLVVRTGRPSRDGERFKLDFPNASVVTGSGAPLELRPHHCPSPNRDSAGPSGALSARVSTVTSHAFNRDDLLQVGRPCPVPRLNREHSLSPLQGISCRRRAPPAGSESAGLQTASGRARRRSGGASLRLSGIRGKWCSAGEVFGGSLDSNLRESVASSVAAARRQPGRGPRGGGPGQ